MVLLASVFPTLASIGCSLESLGGLLRFEMVRVEEAWARRQLHRTKGGGGIGMNPNLDGVTDCRGPASPEDDRRRSHNNHPREHDSRYAPSRPARPPPVYSLELQRNDTNVSSLTGLAGGPRPGAGGGRDDYHNSRYNRIDSFAERRPDARNSPRDPSGPIDDRSGRGAGGAVDASRGSRAYAWGSRRSRSMSPGGYRRGDYRSNRDVDYRRPPWEPRDDFSRSRGRAGGRGDEPPSMDRGQDRDRDYMAARWDESEGGDAATVTAASTAAGARDEVRSATAKTVIDRVRGKGAPVPARDRTRRRRAPAGRRAVPGDAVATARPGSGAGPTAARRRASGRGDAAAAARRARATTTGQTRRGTTRSATSRAGRAPWWATVRGPEEGLATGRRGLPRLPGLVAAPSRRARRRPVGRRDQDRAQRAPVPRVGPDRGGHLRARRAGAAEAESGLLRADARPVRHAVRPLLPGVRVPGPVPVRLHEEARLPAVPDVLRPRLREAAARGAGLPARLRPDPHRPEAGEHPAVDERGDDVPLVGRRDPARAREHQGEGDRLRGRDVRQREEEHHRQHEAVPGAGGDPGLGLELPLRPVVGRLHHLGAVRGRAPVRHARQRGASRPDRTRGGSVPQGPPGQVDQLARGRVLRLAGVAQDRRRAVVPQHRARPGDEADRRADLRARPPVGPGEVAPVASHDRPA
ncbi:hypothetical protein THAOC_06963 [Thalassiosira oceanica]|uniref:Uncharacterized protein n=1 Tax=Thalassiosira oceanica TaxID=159749 RepID=K0T362_THAOC|nr:hypothetical protein THAOC_06963 [Thalassiosira oceanica]|eukprot:EJK71584.1 hypothetical protein THAOC_06963 [Thalassiosira oceanica]